MPPLLVRFGGLRVAPLVVANDGTDVAQLGRPPPTAEQRRAALVQRPAHLLRRHERVFPPAAAGCASPRTPGPPAPGSGAGSGPCRPAPRSPTGPLPVCPDETRAPPSTAGRRPPAPASAARRSRWSGSTSLPRSPR